jgi:acylphosphatase
MDREALVRLRVIFRGRVQGVGFRAAAQDTARGRRVSGWVRNEPDGTVALEVQGSTAEVHAFLTALRRRMGTLIDGEAEATLAIDRQEEGFAVRR